MKRSRNWLYLLDLKVEQPICLAARHTEEPWLWHARYGHLSFDALGRLEKMVTGLPHIEHSGSCGRKYFILLVDDCSRFMWLQLLTSKTEAGKRS